MNLQYDEIELYNPGILKTQLSEIDFKTIKEDVLKQLDNRVPYNGNLSGQIEKEYQVSIPYPLDNILLDMYSEYSKKFKYHVGKKVGIREKVAWVNVQKKYEFNPIHLHDGVVAWVLWLQIPYDLKEEFSLPQSVNSLGPRMSLFEFIYSKLDAGINMQNLEIDKTWQGTLVMFPAYLKHCVYPFFTSEDYRISMASNLIFEA